MEDEDQEVKSVLERVLFIVEANLAFNHDLPTSEQISLIAPNEMASSIVNDISFQLDSTMVDKFMSKVKQR